MVVDAARNICTVSTSVGQENFRAHLTVLRLPVRGVLPEPLLKLAEFLGMLGREVSAAPSVAREAG